MDLFTTFQICKNMGIQTDRLRVWIDKKFIVPHIPATRRGTKNLFKITDIYMIGLFKYLIECGFSREESSKRIKGLYGEIKYCENKDKPFNPALIAFPRKSEGMSEPYLNGTMAWPNTITFGKDAQFPFDNISYFLNFDDVLFVNFQKIKKKIDADFA